MRRRHLSSSLPDSASLHKSWESAALSFCFPSFTWALHTETRHQFTSLIVHQLKPPVENVVLKFGILWRVIQSVYAWLAAVNRLVSSSTNWAYNLAICQVLKSIMREFKTWSIDSHPVIRTSQLKATTLERIGMSPPERVEAQGARSSELKDLQVSWSLLQKLQYLKIS